MLWLQAFNIVFICLYLYSRKVYGNFSVNSFRGGSSENEISGLTVTTPFNLSMFPPNCHLLRSSLSEVKANVFPNMLFITLSMLTFFVTLYLSLTAYFKTLSLHKLQFCTEFQFIKRHYEQKYYKCNCYHGCVKESGRSPELRVVQSLIKLIFLQTSWIIYNQMILCPSGSIR